jgi:carboxypeptidase D
VTDKCPTPISVLGDPNDPLQSVKPTYFDNLAVKKYIHAPLLKKWNLCNSGVFPNGDSSPPSDSNGVLKNVIESSVRSFISQGDLDGLIVTNGSALALQNFVWNGQQGFTKKPSADVVADGKVWGKYITQRNLTFIEYFAAGHGEYL